MLKQETYIEFYAISKSFYYPSHENFLESTFDVVSRIYSTTSFSNLFQKEEEYSVHFSKDYEIYLFYKI